MAALQVHDGVGHLAPLPGPGIGDHQTPEELFRWACFLDQGQPNSVSREHAVDALLSAADGDCELVLRARRYALRAMRLGVGTRGVVDLLQDALDRPA